MRHRPRPLTPPPPTATRSFACRHHLLQPGTRKLEYYNSKEAFDNGNSPRGGLTVTVLYPCAELDNRPGKRNHRIDVQGPPTYSSNDRSFFDSRANPAKSKAQLIIFSLSAENAALKDEWLRALEACLPPDCVKHDAGRAHKDHVPDAVNERMAQAAEDAEQDEAFGGIEEDGGNGGGLMGGMLGKAKAGGEKIKRKAKVLMGGGGDDDEGGGETALKDSLQVRCFVPKSYDRSGAASPCAAVLSRSSRTHT